MLVFSIDYGDVKIYFVGKDEDIKNIRYFYEIQSSNNCHINDDLLLKRMLDNGIYGRWNVGRNPVLKLQVRKYNEALKEHELLINEDDFTNALYYSCPEMMKELLKVSDEDHKFIMENNPWKGVFDEK